MNDNESIHVNHEKHSRLVLAVTVAAWMLAVAAAVYIARSVQATVVIPLLEVATPFVIAIILALFLDPLVDRVQSRGLSRGVGVAIVSLGFVVLLLLVGFLIVPKMVAQTTELASNYQTLSDQAVKQVDTVLQNHSSMLERLRLPTTVNGLADKFSVQLETGAKATLTFATGLLGSFFARILWVVIIPLATIYLLRDWDLMTRRIICLTPESKRDRLIHISGAVGKVFRGYVRGMAIVAVLYSVVASIWLSATGLQYGLVIGALSGLLYMIPYVGVLTAALTIGTMAMVQHPGSPGWAVGLMLGIILQSFVVFDVIVYPKVVGKSVGVHPLLALVALVTGAKLFGLPGMIAAMPVTASIQAALVYVYPELFNSKPPVEEPAESEGTVP